MKKILFALMLLYSVLSHAQFYAGIGAGYTIQRSLAAELHVGYDFKDIFLQAGYLSSLSSSVNKGTAFNIRAGHAFPLNQHISIEPSLGYASILRSNDQKRLNTSGIMTSLYLTNTFCGMGQLFIGGNYVPGMSSLCIGIRFKPSRIF